MTPTETLARALNARKNGSGYTALCPSHPDKNPSLSIREGENGKPLVHCFAGCDQERVIGSLKSRDQWPQSKQDSDSRILDTYDYTDEHGQLLQQIVRETGKKFKVRRPDGDGGWIKKKNPKQVLYNLPKVLKDSHVFVVEGEKDANTINSRGFTATTNAFGANAEWEGSYTETLRGRTVILIPDNDQAGRKRVKRIASALLGQAKRLVILPLEGEGIKDVTDWFHAGHGKDDLKRLVRDALKTPISTVEQIDALWPDIRVEDKGQPKQRAPTILYSPEDLKRMKIPKPSNRIQGLLPSAGVTMLVADKKTGKTVAAHQIGLTVAAALLDHSIKYLDRYDIEEPGAVLMIEVDDPGGATASVKELQARSSIQMRGIPFWLVDNASVPAGLGTDFCKWLEGIVVERQIKVVILDSFTAQRSRRERNDIVKDERDDIINLDKLAKKHNCSFILIHHVGIGGSHRDWDNQAAGTYAVGAAVEAQIHLSRFRDLDNDNPARHVRVRGRHQKDFEMVLKFREETLDFEFVLAGSAAGLYPQIQQLAHSLVDLEQGPEGKKRTPGEFNPEEFGQAVGLKHAQIFRNLRTLCNAGVVARVKDKKGTYRLVADYRAVVQEVQ